MLHIILLEGKNAMLSRRISGQRSSAYTFSQDNLAMQKVVLQSSDQSAGTSHLKIELSEKKLKRQSSFDQYDYYSLALLEVYCTIQKPL